MTSVDKELGRTTSFTVGPQLSARADFSARVLRLVSGLRVLVAAILLIIGTWDLAPAVLGSRYPGLYETTALIYLVLSGVLTVFIFKANDAIESLASAQIAIDIVAIIIMVHASGGVRSGIEGLLAIFVVTAGISLPRQIAYLAAACAAIAVLAEQTLSYAQGVTETSDFVQAGILGTIMLLITFGTQPLLRRIEESEALARQRGIDLADLAQLNEYIIQNLRESILVVDNDGRIRLLNQSAAELLGTARDSKKQRLLDVSPELNTLLDEWRRADSTDGETPNFMSKDGTSINIYIAPLGKTPNGAVLLFLEDASILADRVQQSKLAALGRLSASIAHEIRNPVGALSHAGQLLAESPELGEEELRFLDIIQKNSKRVSNIVDNVLKLSRKDAAHPEELVLNDWCREFAEEFTGTLELNEGELSVHDEDTNVRVSMDPGHLHQVAWNLCENAIKYASKTAGGIAVEIRIGRRPSSGRPFMNIVDQGGGIPEHLQENLFEPFATGPEGGTGLGLYICRELCEQNKATLRYLPGPHGGSIFQVVFTDPGRWNL